MKNNTGRNIFLIILGYYLLTGNYKAARNLIIAYVLALLIAAAIVLGVTGSNHTRNSTQEAYRLELKAEQNEKDRQEGEQYAADVLPVFVKQFKGKTLKGDFMDYGGLDSYGLKFKILNDSILSYQITEDEDYSPYSYMSRHKWSKSKKTSYTLAPAINSDGSYNKEKLVFQFENYQGELDVIKSKKKKKFKISTPLTLKDADNLIGCFWEP